MLRFEHKDRKPKLQSILESNPLKMHTITAVPAANRDRTFSTDVKSGHDVGCAWVNIPGLIKAKATCVTSETSGFSGIRTCCLTQFK